MKRFLERLIPPLVCCAALAVQAVDVHMIEQAAAGGVINTFSERIAGTGTNVVSSAAPTISDYLFTHWTLSTAQPYNQRDIDGRAYDALPFILFEDTTLTAHYLPVAEDSDSDGIPDGWEWYWYNGLLNDAASDTDSDGYTFAEELKAGLHPNLKDTHTNGGVVWDGSAVLQYNPKDLQPYTIRSNPEGALFESIMDYASVGTKIVTPTGDVSKTTFAYWTRDGVPVRDVDGRAFDYVSFTMPNKAVEFVAHTIEDENDRILVYWQYSTEGGASGDKDGDGYTFVEEMAAGLNPNQKDSHTNGGVVWDDSGLIDYNPHNLAAYIIRSEPEGELFETISDFAKVGSVVTTPTGDRYGTKFAYWTLDGVMVRDKDGRALDIVKFSMPNKVTELVAHTVEDENERMKYYWYGTSDVASYNDSDGDGYTLEAELAAGLNPHLFDSHTNGGVVWSDSDLMEVNLQVYEQAHGALMGGKYSDFFASPIAGVEGISFGENAAPAICDWNGDGKRDIIVAFKGGVRLFVNNGTAANPDLAEMAVPENLASAFAAMENPLIAGDGANALYFASLADTNVWRYAIKDGTIASTGKTGLFGAICGDLTLIDDCTLDTPLLDGLSLSFADVNLDGVSDFLASDIDGRIWDYQGSGVSGQESGVSNSSTPTLLHSLTYTLQHKVWGGSHAGFANGLKLAATDWDDDGDLDCVCGTAEGKLMLLNDPRGGRPSNVSLAAGADSVSIKWDANAQSRIRGYYVYRRAQGGNWSRLEGTTLPRYLDKPPEGTDNYDYRVTSVSRFYTTGNSKPTTVESVATDTLSATLAKVAFTWRPAAGFAGDDVKVDFAVENALNLSAENMVLKISYDPNVLVPVEVIKSGLTEKLEFVETRGSGSWLVSGTGGTIAPGSGTFLSFSFAVADGKALADAKVTVEEFTLKSIANRNVIPEVLKGSGDLDVEVADPDDAAQVPAGSYGDLDGNGRLGWDDIELFLKWKDVKHDEIPLNIRRAGDYNGDGRMDNRDYVLMRRHYREREKRGGRMTGWDKNHGYRGNGK